MYSDLVIFFLMYVTDFFEYFFLDLNRLYNLIIVIMCIVKCIFCIIF